MRMAQIQAKYRKTHLFAAAPIEEHKCFSPGDELISFALGELRLGLSICYDLRFPEVYRTLAVKDDANVFIISSAWPFPRVEHFRILALARAIENQSYVIVANRVGTDDGVSFFGTSAIIDPYGVTIAAASPDREELIVAEISQKVIQNVRNRMAVFAHRRQDLYEKHRVYPRVGVTPTRGTRHFPRLLALYRRDKIGFRRNGRFACALPQRLLDCAPGQHRALDPLREFPHACSSRRSPNMLGAALVSSVTRS